MHILLGSGGFRTDERVRTFRTHLQAHLGSIQRVLFIPYALHDHDKYVQTIVERGLHADYELVGIHRCPNPRDAVLSAEAIYIGGGNTFRLLNALYQLDLLGPIRERVRAGVPYVGVSAGSNVACPTIMTTNDMPIVQPPSFNALGLVPFQINAHFYTGNPWVRPLTPNPSPPEGRGEAGFVEHFGETRDERLREFHEMNDTPVVGLWEAGILLCDGATATLHAAGARIFRKGQDPLDVEPGADLMRYGMV
ncbi:MAG: dipeptidase PepE [Planctomycetes bacterium]|nr:dipeptidase PepE [Planctomycetota bacterium]